MPLNCNVTIVCQHGPLSSTACGLTIVIPTMGRRPKISALLFRILLHPLMQRDTSEILLSHGSKHAWQMRDNITSAIHMKNQLELQQLPGPRADTTKLRHLDGSIASAELGAAERYLAAGSARNEVVVQVDDDARPDPR